VILVRDKCVFHLWGADKQTQQMMNYVTALPLRHRLTVRNGLMCPTARARLDTDLGEEWAPLRGYVLNDGLCSLPEQLNSEKEKER